MRFDYTKLATIKDTRLCIYKITNTQNNKVYVGKTEATLISRIRRHCMEVRKGTNRYLYDAIRHHGWDTFSVEVIEACSSLEELNEREIYWIAALKSQDKNFGYNMTEGGDGVGFTPEALKKSADMRRGIPRSDEVKKKISDGNKGKTVIVSEETKKKISATLKGRMPEKPIHKIMEGKPGARLGVKHTEESKKLMSLHQKGKPRWTEDQKQQMSLDRMGEKNAFWTDVSREELSRLIKDNLTLDKISNKLNVSVPTVLAKIKYFFNVNGLRAARKILCEDSDVGLETTGSQNRED